jgi:predicted nucleic acid-binding protein
MEVPRIYADTSVFGGCFNPGFERVSRAVFDLVREGRIRLLFSSVVLDELRRAPPRVGAVLEDLPPASVEEVVIDGVVRSLPAAYLASRVVELRASNDALHVAAATAARADALTSWNFTNIVRFDRVHGFNSVNYARGFRAVTIIPPQGILLDEPGA